MVPDERIALVAQQVCSDEAEPCDVSDSRYNIFVQSFISLFISIPWGSLFRTGYRLFTLYKRVMNVHAFNAGIHLQAYTSCRCLL